MIQHYPFHCWDSRNQKLEQIYQVSCQAKYLILHILCIGIPTWSNFFLMTCNTLISQISQGGKVVMLFVICFVSACVFITVLLVLWMKVVDCCLCRPYNNDGVVMVAMVVWVECFHESWYHYWNDAYSGIVAFLWMKVREGRVFVQCQTFWCTSFSQL